MWFKMKVFRPFKSIINVDRHTVDNQKTFSDISEGSSWMFKRH